MGDGVVQRRWLGWLAALVLLAAFIFIVVLIVKALAPDPEPWATEKELPTVVSSGESSSASEALEQADQEDVVRGLMSMRYGDFPVIRKEGTGDRTIPIPVDPTVMMVRVTNKSGTPLNVWGADANGQPLELIVATDTVYKGTHLYDTRLYHPKTIKVIGEGDWVVKLLPISEARLMEPIITAGTGDTIVLFDGKEARFTTTHTSATDFKVTVIGDGESEVLADGNQTMAGLDPAIDGPAIVAVETDGKWTITKQGDAR